ncbi:YihY/virulence factor BrkB family protein [Luteithermobacter gelatinilyticus]|uniref:YihY/virulence factor BrkB family protein n=1 Tax=Luteithermobacter gelatinilyticus TaxID=2582913 RepID=UPI00110636F7|nr:YihY/virulence factor BrkB family protein [Luteithermobacter gelatinilyticus]|tara:strand:+ start:5903 stop:6790 length:888 start_codon:yes stop_codon:yes gene_type:complete
MIERVKQTLRPYYDRVSFLVEAVINFNRHDGMVMAGYLAFLTLLALFPFIIFLVSLAGFFGQSEAGHEALEILFNNIPPDVVRVLRAPIEKMIQTTSGSIMTFSILGAIWVSASAIDAARLAIVRSFASVTRRPYIRRRAEGLLLVILSASGIIVGMSILVLGPVAWNIIISYIPVDTDWKLIWNAVRFTLSITLVFGALCLVYYVLRPRRLKIRPPLAPGALAALILWMGIGSSFSLYLKHFARYDVTYGSLAGAIIALMFFYFISAAFILGAEINAALYHKRIRKQNQQVSRQ